MNQQEMEFLATLAERGFEHVRATDVGSRVEAQRFSTGLPPDRRADFWAGWGKGEGKARRRAKSAAKPIVKNGDARPAAPELLPQESPASKPRVAPADGRATVTSAPDRPIHVTILADRTGVKVHRTEMTLDELRQAILDTSAPAKDQLYWLKLARFGGKRSPRGSLRTNDNVLAISGVELDYDGKVMSFDEAVRIANAARLKCILYTTPSYTDAEPKWRVLAPTSQELAPSERVRLAARINGVFGGIFAPESFVLSQGFIFGSVNHNPAHRAVIVEGEFVDDRDDLDAIAIGKDNGAESIDPSCDDAPGELQAPIELVAAALAVIPNTDPSWIFWNRIAMAIFGATAGDNAGFDLFDRWSQKWSGYSERDTAARWQALRRSPPDKIGAGTLFFLADEIDPRWRDRRDAATGDEATAVNEAPASETKPAASAAPAVKKKPTATAEFFDPWERYAVPAFPFEVLPEVLRTFIADQSEVIGCDPSALAMSALGVVGGAITHELKLRMNQHDNGAFTVSTCLWVLLIADSGTKKTPLLSTTAMPLIKAHADEMKRYAALLAEWEADESNNKGPQPIEPAGYVIHDTTVEALGIALSHSDRGILVYADELSGWIEAMERYGGKTGDRAFWLKARTGGLHEVRRVSRKTNVIHNLSAGVIGGIQPEKLATITGLQIDGLLQRFVVVMMNSGRMGCDKPSGPSSKAYEVLIRSCLGIQKAELTMTPDAYDAMWELRKYLDDLTHVAPSVSAGFQAFVSKLVGVAGNLALILHVAKDPVLAISRDVTVETINSAARIVKEFVLPHAFELYGSTAGEGAERLRKIASYVLTSRKKEFKPSDFTRNVTLLGGMGIFDLRNAISPLVAGGWLAVNSSPAAPRWFLEDGVAEKMDARRQDEERRKQALAELMGARRRAH